MLRCIFVIPKDTNDQFGCGILKMVGPIKVRYMAKNQHTSKEKKSYKECQFIKNWT